MNTMSADGQYLVAKATVISKLQQITVNGFLPALGITQADLEAASQDAFGFSRKLQFFDFYGAFLIVVHWVF